MEPASMSSVPAETPSPEVTASGKTKKRFVGKARKQQLTEGSTDSTTIEDSAVAIRDGKMVLHGSFFR